MVRLIKRFTKGKTMETMPMENRVMGNPQDLANLHVASLTNEERQMTTQELAAMHVPGSIRREVVHPEPNFKKYYAYQKLQECYRHLGALVEKREIPYAVIASLHNHTTKVLRELKDGN